MRSISDDDLCATCAHCTYRPGELSQCSKNWPTEDADEVENCPAFEQLCVDRLANAQGDE
ncbi:hypothetical protein C3Z06_30980 (plasmid) [Cupriavidus metallidurans]|nr:hypothetical protein C3Z06_30980 [Cupriavidus metallidurans]